MARLHKSSLMAALLASSFSAWATNGMNLEGYGATAAAQGGAAMAYDNGTAALMNNPATLALGKEGFRLDIAGGFLGPNVHTNAQKSFENAFYMPALGLAYKRKDWVFGFGVFSQGGMGAGYNNSDMYDRLHSMNGAPIADPMLQNRSELGVGRMLFPFAWKATDRLSLGGSIDYVWATLDLKMLIDGAHFADMMAGTKRFGSVTPDAQMGGMLNSIIGGGGQINWGYFDFSDQNRFNGAAKGQGFAAKIGATYKVSDAFSLGASYHSKTNLSDLEADSATMVMNVSGQAMPMSGKVSVKNFQWPSMLGLGFAWQASDRLQLVADYRRIGWKSVMKEFRMVFESHDFGAMDLSLRQDWKNQNVLMLGGSYRANDQWTLRAGANIANNPVPNEFVNPLFPAIIRNHLTAGLGYAFDQKSSIDFSMTYAPKVKAHSAFSNTDITHSQINGQMIYAMTF